MKPVRLLGALISQLALVPKGSCPHPQLRKAPGPSLGPGLCIRISREGVLEDGSTDLTPTSEAKDYDGAALGNPQGKGHQASHTFPLESSQ